MRAPRFVENLNTAMREDPLAAGLIGLGLAWIAFRRSDAVVRQTSETARSAKGTFDTAVGATKDAISSTSDAISSTAAGAVKQLRKAAGGMSDRVSDGVKAATAKVDDLAETGFTGSGEAANRSVDHQEDFRSPLARGFTDMLERQPLALGVLGVAAGAALASAFPSTETEDRLMGTAGEALRDDVRDAADVVSDKIGSVVDAVTDEAVAQGLTPSALKEAAAAGVGKAKAVSQAARDSIKRG